jgi:hypothetical protein
MGAPHPRFTYCTQLAVPQGYPADRGGSPLISGAREVGTGAKDMPSHCRAHAKGRPLPKSVRGRYRPILLKNSVFAYDRKNLAPVER